GPKGSYGESLLIDLGLLFLFALQHSGMARKRFKKWWTRLVPEPIERSTYVLVSSLLLLFLFRQWRPIPSVVWELEYPPGQRVVELLFWLGWLIAMHSVFLIDHREFLGLRQVWLYARGKPYEPVKFKMPDVYRYVRHPLMLGLLMGFWATPVMTLGHFVFAFAFTVYVLIGIRLEERDLVELYGEAYQEYRRRVSMLIPLPRKKVAREQ
ncbi:MAG: isoprenylcysteine carboxylmethyltransferase family protein, partial [Deltaproteobacteria bacterium]|nr:isoprenylcysteine carboxylmethyltransferase family protein [Deltaproteobacteria bacterium]